MKKKRLIIALVLLTAAIAGAVACSYLFKNKEGLLALTHLSVATSTQTSQTASQCLTSDEHAEYVQNNVSAYVANVTVHVLEANGKISNTFTIPDVFPSYRPIEIYNCGMYVLRQFGWDSKTDSPTPSWDISIWHYNFEGQGKKLITLGYEKSPGNDVTTYGYQFDISPDERFVSLVQGYEGTTTFAIDIKNLPSTTDAFVLPLEPIFAKTPALAGSVGFGEAGGYTTSWTKDGRYFWADFFNGAYEAGWIRIDTKNWTYQTFVAPDGVLGGYPLNVDTGWVPVVPGAFWTGTAEIDAQIRQQRQEAGQTASLYLYNVFTGQKILVKQSDSPTWQGVAPTWLNDSTLQYHLPAVNELGATTTYTLPQ